MISLSTYCEGLLTNVNAGITAIINKDICGLSDIPYKLEPAHGKYKVVYYGPRAATQGRTITISKPLEALKHITGFIIEDINGKRSVCNIKFERYKGDIDLSHWAYEDAMGTFDAAFSFNKFKGDILGLPVCSSGIVKMEASIPGKIDINIGNADFMAENDTEIDLKNLKITCNKLWINQVSIEGHIKDGDIEHVWKMFPYEIAPGIFWQNTTHDKGYFCPYITKFLKNCSKNWHCQHMGFLQGKKEGLTNVANYYNTIYNHQERWWFKKQ